MKRFVAVLSLTTLVTCGGGPSSDAPSTNPTAPAVPVQTYPVTYQLALLKAPYAPGSVFSRSAECGYTLQSSIVAGTLTLQKFSGTISFRAWNQYLTVRNSINCQTRVETEDLSTSKTIGWAVNAPTGELVISVNGQKFATGVVTTVQGEAKFPTTLKLDFPGWQLLGSGLAGTAVPYSMLSTGTEWRQAAQ